MITRIYTLSRFSVIYAPVMRQVLRQYQERGSLTFSEERKGGKVFFKVTAEEVFHQGTTDFFTSSNVPYTVKVR